jgi:hypothetical protein
MTAEQAYNGVPVLFHECKIEDPVAQLAAAEYLAGTDQYPFPFSVVCPSTKQLISVLTSCNTIVLKRSGLLDVRMSGAMAMSRTWEPTDVCQRHVRGNQATLACLLRRSDGAWFVDSAGVSPEEFARLSVKLETVGEIARGAGVKRGWGCIILEVDAVFHGLHEWITAIRIVSGHGSLSVRERIFAVSQGDNHVDHFTRILPRY